MKMAVSQIQRGRSQVKVCKDGWLRQFQIDTVKCFLLSRDPYPGSIITQ